MIAALPMYDRPELRPETDRFWVKIREGLRARGIAAPDALSRGRDLWDIWQSPELVFAQTCGLPYRARLADRVALIAAPVHAVGPPGQYHSVIIAATQAVPKHPRIAVNDALSQSGWANLHLWMTARGILPGDVMVTGAHQASAQAVRDGRADLAAIDMVTWGHLRRFEAWADGIAVLDRTASVPALPYIAARGADLAAHRAALSEAVAALSPEDRAALNLHGVTVLPQEAYTDLPLPPRLPGDR